MSRILFAWELGANLGHLARFGPIAEKVRAGGHQVLVAARDLRSAAQVLGVKGFALVQAPLFHRRNRSPAAPASYAEMLALEGYADQASLWGMVRGWISLARLFRADSIVADHAPGALIAGRILGLPRAQIGNGFEIPPQRSPMPSIRPWENIPQERLQRSDEKVRDTINGALRSFGTLELERLSDLFNIEARLFATFPELDPYAPRLDERYVGPIYESQAGDPMVWPDDGRPRIFVYLRQSVRGIGDILRALKQTGKDTGARTVCVLPDAGPATLRELTSETFRVTSRPLRLDSVLPRADLAVLYGGHGTMSAAMLAGVPLLVTPQSVEQYLHAKCLEALGCGTTLVADRDPAGITVQVQRALASGELKASCTGCSEIFRLVAPSTLPSAGPRGTS